MNTLIDNIVPVPGYEKYYGATSDGKVFSFNYNRTGETKELAQTSLYDKRRNSKTMYKRAKMYHINKNTPTAIHRIIAITFIPNPNNLPQVNHIDGDKSNNFVENLEWCSVKSNVNHAEMNGLNPHVRGEDHPKHILSTEEVKAIKKELKETINYRGQLTNIAKKYGVTLHCIFDIKRGRSWVHI
jgi:hypothetical protein